MASVARPAAQTVARPASRPVNGYTPPAPPSDPIPANAIYANGEAIPDPAGGGYLTYGATT